MSLYYECHVTVDPLFDDDLEQFKYICKKYGFRVADLLMQKRKTDTPERSKFDTFCTGRAAKEHALRVRMFGLINSLQEAGVKVRRYKIEDAVLDSKIKDEYNLLTVS